MLFYVAVRALDLKFQNESEEVMWWILGIRDLEGEKLGTVLWIINVHSLKH